MKTCSKCGGTFPDEKSFCSNCGIPLADFGNSIPTQNPKSLNSFNQPNFQPTNQSNQPNNMGQQQKNNSTLIIVIISLVVVLLIACITLAVVLFKSSNQEDSDHGSQQTQEVSSQKQTSDSPQSSDDTSSQGDESISNTDLTTYQMYADSLDASFGNYIMSDQVLGQYTTYQTGLTDAIAAKNEDNCQYNMDKLNELQEALKESSVKKISELEEKIKSQEGKSYAKSTKGKSEYKKNKKLAQTSVQKGDYANAKVYYEACVDALNDAKNKSTKKPKKTAKPSSGSTQTKGNDTWYQTGAQDNVTYSEVFTTYLSEYEVRNFSKEMKRYYMNTLFAAYGYRFNNSTIQSFFNRQSWYYPDYSYSPGDQNGIKSKFDDMCLYNYRLLGGS